MRKAKEKANDINLVVVCVDVVCRNAFAPVVGPSSGDPVICISICFSCDYDSYEPFLFRVTSPQRLFNSFCLFSFSFLNFYFWLLLLLLLEYLFPISHFYFLPVCVSVCVLVYLHWMAGRNRMLFFFSTARLPFRLKDDRQTDPKALPLLNGSYVTRMLSKPRRTDKREGEFSHNNGGIDCKNSFSFSYKEIRDR